MTSLVNNKPFSLMKKNHEEKSNWPEVTIVTTATVHNSQSFLNAHIETKSSVI